MAGMRAKFSETSRAASLRKRWEKDGTKADTNRISIGETEAPNARVPHGVIVGGGFGGLAAAKLFARRRSKSF
jgi:NADPH-dependent 2,4-dienoyl-CoA reductase/sulfur reductase-like enzyme